MFQLNLLGAVSPLVGELLGLIGRVDRVPECPLGSQEVGEVAGLDVAKIQTYHVLVVPDHSTHPFVVVPSAHARDRDDRADV